MKIKKASKRLTLKKKYNIEHKVREHNKKVKKFSKQQTNSTRRRRKKVRIPNNWPFKEELLKQIQREKIERANEKKNQKSKMFNVNAAEESSVLQQKSGATEDIEMDNSKQAYEDLMQKAQKETSLFNSLEKSFDKEIPNYSSGKKRHYSDLYETIKKSNVLIEVLDARDPNSCRNSSLENEIVAQGKHLILLLNKVDLVPKEIVEKWVYYLRQFYPTTFFKASTSKSINHSKTPYSNASRNELSSTTLVFGVKELQNLLKNYARTDTNSTKCIIVGVIGYPNVGKSSVINSLCRNAKATCVGAEPGITRVTQEVVLDSKTKIIDSPGVIPFNEENEEISLILRNVVRLSNIKARIEVVDALIKKYPIHDLMRWFKVPLFTSTDKFLEHVARTHGKLLKGGEFDYDGAAQFIIHQWTSGKIEHFCLPPDDSAAISCDDIKIVSDLSTPFVICEIS